jgi:hypothetical protein
MPKIWITTDGTPPTSILGVFSTRGGAERYLADVVERYASGGKLRHLGEPIARDAGDWQLGLGPAVIERDVDLRLETLPGAWLVKVDESCRMVACTFSTELAPTHPASTYRTGIHHICQAHGPTPRHAFDAARRCMMAYLASPRSTRQEH